MATINGTSGDDVLFNTVGQNDTINGEAGTDTVSYAIAGGADGGVVVDLSSGMTYDRTNFDEDTLSSIENVTGSAFDDLLIGNEFANVLDGGAGNDTLTGGAGDDTLIGGDGADNLDGGDGGDVLVGGAGDDTLNGGLGTDTVSYASASAGVTVDLSAVNGWGEVKVIDDSGNTDTLISIENVTGSGYNDSLTGDDLANVLAGGAGDDTLTGSAGDDTLTGSAGDDIFNYSFNLAQSSGGGSTTTHTFTDWLSAKYGKDYGDELPDYVPAHHHKHDKDDNHGKNDKHHSKDDDHGKNDQHDKHGKDDGHHSKDGDHDHHGHGGDDGHHAPHGGLTEKFFEQNYKEWLKEVVVADLLEQGFVLDANGDGKIKIDINEDSRNGTPRIEGLTKDQLAEIFGDRDSVILRDGHETEKAWYSNSFTSSSSGETTAAVTSGDGFDTIVDFGSGADKLQFDFSADTNWAAGQADSLAYLESFFNIDRPDFANNGTLDARLSVDMNNDGNAEWSVVLADSGNLTDAQVFAALDISVNGTLIG